MNDYMRSRYVCPSDDRRNRCERAHTFSHVIRDQRNFVTFIVVLSVGGTFTANACVANIIA